MRAAADRIVSVIDTANRLLGRSVAWLTLGMVMVEFAVVLLRYVFGVGFIAVQEAVVYMHALTFMLAAGWTLSDDAHVRVDVFYREASATTKAWIDLAGVVALLWPVCAVIWVKALPYVLNSWAVHEGSTETSGLAGVYLLKTAILVMPVIVGLQGLALALRSLCTIAQGKTEP